MLRISHAGTVRKRARGANGKRGRGRAGGAVCCNRFGNLISTRLQPGGSMAAKTQPLQRFRGGWKPLKRLQDVAGTNTRLKPGANERLRVCNKPRCARSRARGNSGSTPGVGALPISISDFGLKPRINTDEHGLKPRCFTSPAASVSIRVHPWLNGGFQIEINIQTRADE